MKIVNLLSNNLLYSVGDDRSLRIWKILKADYENVNNVQSALEVYGHGARVLCVESGKKEFVFTGAADQSICIWKWDKEEKRNIFERNLLLVKKVMLNNCGAIRCLLMVNKILVVTYFIFYVYN